MTKIGRLFGTNVDVPKCSLGHGGFAQSLPLDAKLVEVSANWFGHPVMKITRERERERPQSETSRPMETNINKVVNSG